MYGNTTVPFGSRNLATCDSCYDAAGNMRMDMAGNSLRYDAEGNVTNVGSTAFTYDALNHRVRVDTGSAATEFVFNKDDQRVSIWDPSSQQPVQGQFYWGSVPIAYYAGGSTHFQNQDWVGTERVRTSYLGGSGELASL